MKLIINIGKRYHVSFDTVKEFEETITSDKINSLTTVQTHRYIYKASYLFWQKMKMHYSTIKLVTIFNTLYSKTRKTEPNYFCILMGPNWEKCFPYFMLSGKKSIYLFDAWPTQHKNILRFANSMNLDHVFVSSSQSALALQSIAPKPVFTWIPEAINPALYRYYDYKNKDIDVLALGRKFDIYHNKIVNGLKNNQRSYLYEEIKGIIVFPTREEFILGLARTKISICFPSSITHPERSENIETMTVRYLQSMASKCLILGQAPKEMINLFGYNPVIEINMDDPVKQLDYLLDHFEDCIPLIEKNYSTVIEQHTWQKRWEKIHEIIK